MARLCLSLLGAFSATLDGNPIHGFKTAKVRALLAYLAVERARPHRREALVGLLWPDFPEKAARANLRYALTSLRKALGDGQAQSPYLLVAGETIQFNPSGDYWLDVQVFEDRLKPAPPTEDSYARLEEAVALYRGSFLEGFSLRNSSAFDEWSLLVREQLQRQAAQALSRLVGWHGQSGHYEKACDFARQQIELEPWQEDAHRQLMRLLAQSGQQLAALAQFEICRRSLVEELGIEPAVETVQLCERIRDGLIDVGAAEEAPPHNLPASLSPLIGRQGELAEIEERLLDSSCRLLTLLGPGGIGKTRLALEAAAYLVKYFGQGVYFVPLAPLQSCESIPPAIARVLGFSFSPGGEPFQQLLDYLRKKELLLVLDTFEHLRGGVGLIVDLLHAAPGVKVLVTSREGLNLSEEFLFPMEGLDYPDPQLQDPLTFDAVRLFLEGTRRVCPHYRASTGDLAQIGLVCRKVQGMPLAILLAASWMELLSPAEIAHQVSSHSLDFLAAEWRDVPERQRSMRLVFDHSWRLLGEEEQQLFASLSVFRGSFRQTAAEAITGVSPRDLLRLVNKSMVQGSDAGRCEMHELLRQYGAEKLEGFPTLWRTVHERFAAFYIAALERLLDDLQGPRQADALQAFEPVFANAQAAWSWAIEDGQVGYLERGMDGLGEFYDQRGRLREGEQAFQAAVEKLKELIHVHPYGSARGGDERLRLLAKALAWQANFSRQLSHKEAARQALEESLAVLDSPGLAARDTCVETAFALYQAGWFYELNDVQQARNLLRESLDAWRKAGNRWWTAKVLAILGSFSVFSCDLPQARKMLDESLSIRRQLGDRRSIANTLLLISDLAYAETKYAEYLAVIQESLAIYREIGDRHGLADGLLLLGVYYDRTSAWLEARSVFDETAAIFEELGIRRSFGQSIHFRGRVEIKLGLLDAARTDLQAAMEILKETDDQYYIGKSYDHTAYLEVREGHLLKALHDAEEAVAVFRKIRASAGLITALGNLAKVECLQALFDRARQHICEAFALAIKTTDLGDILNSLPTAALLLAGQQGKLELAVEIYSLADYYYNHKGPVVYHMLEEEQIRVIIASLPAEVVAAAEGRGRARDLEATLKELLVEFNQQSSI